MYAKFQIGKSFNGKTTDVLCVIASSLPTTRAHLFLEDFPQSHYSQPEQYLATHPEDRTIQKPYKINPAICLQDEQDDDSADQQSVPVQLPRNADFAKYQNSHYQTLGAQGLNQNGTYYMGMRTMTPQTIPRRPNLLGTTSWKLGHKAFTDNFNNSCCQEDEEDFLKFGESSQFDFRSTTTDNSGQEHFGTAVEYSDLSPRLCDYLTHRFDRTSFKTPTDQEDEIRKTWQSSVELPDKFPSLAARKEALKASAARSTSTAQQTLFETTPPPRRKVNSVFLAAEENTAAAASSSNASTSRVILPDNAPSLAARKEALKASAARSTSTADNYFQPISETQPRRKVHSVFLPKEYSSTAASSSFQSKLSDKFSFLEDNHRALSGSGCFSGFVSDLDLSENLKLTAEDSASLEQDVSVPRPIYAERVPPRVCFFGDRPVVYDRPSFSS